MIRTCAARATVTVALIAVVRTAVVTAVVTALFWLGASRAYADEPRERPCQPSVESAVRAALPTATAVRCPVVNPEYQIVNGQSVLQPDTAPVTAEAVLLDGRIATVELVVDDAVKANAARPEAARRTVRAITYQHHDLTGSSGKSMALLFWAFALISVVGALFVISRRNLIAAVMGMVGSFFGIAAIYMMLYARFIAVIQMLVYAGAIMVLFVFVVMILNRPEDEPVAPSGRIGQVLGGVAIAFLVWRLILILIHVEPVNVEVAMNAPQPAPAQCVEWQKADNGGLTCTTERPDWGSIKAVGADLFGPGLFPFEAISILLLVAVVGAIAIARPLREQPEDAGESGADSSSDSRAGGGAA
ncbi:MAG TPA: NADH-quinone oxidoreductase subunit J [Kofleriaceae bacterium]|jgi:NADH-quinone oxidoreductase subunit J|nr:NADH-quinone oxidoreductase subunit J [Kofleriaceae bacterium]